MFRNRSLWCLECDTRTVPSSRARENRVYERSAATVRGHNQMTNMNSAEMLRVVDHAAAMDDRWLFLAAFCLLLVLCGVVIRWLVQQLQTLIADHKALQETHSASLTEIINHQNEMARQLAVCIDRNTAALEDCNLELRLIRERK